MDTVIFSHVLYQLSYPGLCGIVEDSARMSTERGLDAARLTLIRLLIL